MAGQRSNDSQDSATTQIRLLRSGHAGAQAWLIDRFTPALFMSARYRIHQHLRGLYDPEDLVQEVWAVALPRLEDLRARDGHYTPVILRFLITILLNKYQNLMQKHLREKLKGVPSAQEPFSEVIKALPDETTTIISRAIRHETWEKIRDVMQRLSREDRRIVILRGIEQISNQDAALVLDEPPATVSTRYRRALEKLRNLLPDTFFSDLHE